MFLDGGASESLIESERRQKAMTCARNGARFLDKTYPGWRESIIIDELNIVLDGGCIIGQLFGSWEVWFFNFNDVPVDDMAYFGFGLPPEEDISYDDLTQAWKELLTKNPAMIPCLN